MVYINGIPVDMTMLEALKSLNQNAGNKKAIHRKNKPTNKGHK